MADRTHSMDNGQAAIKAQLLELLGDTYGRLTALEEKIDPTPVPLPDSIRTAALYTCKRLADEQAALRQAAEDFSRQVEAFRVAVSREAKPLALGGNRSAWSVIFEGQQRLLCRHAEAVDATLGSLLEGTSAMRRLIAYSAEEALLEDIAHGEVPRHE